MKLNIQSQGKGLPLVLLHGWGFDLTVWQPLTQTLGNRFCLYLVDLPGFGKSSLMNWEQFKQTLLLQLPPKFAVCGWSLGGFFATRLALEAPQRVSHLLNIASSPRFVSGEDWPGVSPALLEDFYRRLKDDTKKTIENFIRLQWNEFELNTVPGLQGLQSGLEVLSSWDLRDDLALLGMPVGYFFGKRDLIIPSATIAVLKNKYPHFHYYLFEKAGHTPFLTQRELFESKLDEFLL